jgi:hypothetical protein
MYAFYMHQVHVSRLVVPDDLCDVLHSVDHAGGGHDLIVIKCTPLPYMQRVSGHQLAIEDDGLGLLGV